LSNLLELTAQDRVLVFAPHPDDESIATGGLLQKAREAGAACRLVIVTDGDNNPWPQRWMEKRWHIGATERARWGARRREEARAAMRILGISEDDARFFGLPDLGITDLLMRADASVVQSFCDVIEEFSPTLLVMPALSDRHPDHSATHILARLALQHCRAAIPQLLAFAVHGKVWWQSPAGVPLNDNQRSIKRAAILAHASQMKFSSGRFLDFARDHEAYQSVQLTPSEDLQHPLRALWREGNLKLTIDTKYWASAMRGTDVFVVIERGEQSSQRFRIELNSGAGEATVRDCVGAKPATSVSVQRSDSAMVLSIPFEGDATIRQGYVKLARREPGWRVFDRFGWQTIVS
jgi:LmbE family N-acetylglucosaminyl deacetylase